MPTTTEYLHPAAKHTAFVPCITLLSVRPSRPILPTTTSAPTIHIFKRSRSIRMAAHPAPEDEEETALPEEIMQREWREFRAALVVGSAEQLERSKQTAYRTGHWAHPLAVPEQGCFLASHPAYYRRSAPYLTQAVVFITQYDIATGATGLVLNRPLHGTLSEQEAKGMLGRSSNFSQSPMASHPLYSGGPDLIDRGVLTVLHGQSEIASQTPHEPLKGVFVGDVHDYLKDVDDGMDVSDARLFNGCIRWKPGALESEVDEGSWFCISASPLYALEHCIQLPKPLWVEIMQSQGKLFAKIASQVYNEDEEET